MEQDTPPKILSGKDALELWRQGKEKWNIWVAENPVASIDFSGIDFSDEYTEQQSIIDFSNYTFPKGFVNFSNTYLSAERVLFENTVFSDGNVHFREAKFSRGNVSFRGAIFGKGHISFSDAIFVLGLINFSGVIFGDGGVSFSNTCFGKGEVCFRGAKFGKGNIDFINAKFNEGDIDFAFTSFSEGNTIFSWATLGKGNVNFDYSIFNGHIALLNLKNIDHLQSFSFRHATFKQSFNISNNHFNLIPDLTYTQITNQFSLETLKCKPKFSRSQGCFKFQVADDKEDIPRLRRLKEIAEENKDHERALDFHAWEMRAKRWHVNTSFWGLLLDYSFDFFSDYGRSEKRPLFGLFVTWLLFSIPYFLLSPVKHFGFNGGVEKFSEALSFSASQMIPFIPGSRLARSEGVTTLFGGDLSVGVHLLTFSQSVISFVFLFLIGLALRNRFRI